MKSDLVIVLFVVVAVVTQVRARTDCSAPNCNNLFERGTLWPSLDATLFFECVQLGVQSSSAWIPMVLSCPCNTLFDFDSQLCQSPWNWLPFCREYNNINPVPCDV